MDLSSEQMAELRELAESRDVSTDVALRARIVLWSGKGRQRKDIAELAGVAPLAVDRCKARYAERGLAGLEEKRRGGPRTQVPPQVHSGYTYRAACAPDVTRPHVISVVIA